VISPPGHIFVRNGELPSSGEVTLYVVRDKKDGLGIPGRSGIIRYGGFKGGFLHVSISQDGHTYSSEYVIPSFLSGYPNFIKIRHDDGIFISIIRLTGITGEPYQVVVMPGRDLEGEL
jgi:hypothetical protein